MGQPKVALLSRRIREPKKKQILGSPEKFPDFTYENVV